MKDQRSQPTRGLFYAVLVLATFCNRANTGIAKIAETTNLAPRNVAVDVSDDITTTDSDTSEEDYQEDEGTSWGDTPKTEIIGNEIRAAESPEGTNHAQSRSLSADNQTESAVALTDKAIEDEIARRIAIGFQRLVKNKLIMLHFLPSKMPDIITFGPEDISAIDTMADGNELKHTTMAAEITPVTGIMEAEVSPISITTTSTGDEITRVTRPVVPEFRHKGKLISSKSEPMNDNKQVEGIPIRSATRGESTTARRPVVPKIRHRGGLISSMSRFLNDNKQVTSSPISTTGDESTTEVRSPEMHEIKPRSRLLSYKSRPTSDNKQVESTTMEGESATVGSEEVSEFTLGRGLLSSKSRPINDNKQVETTPINSITEGESATVGSPEVSEDRLRSGLLLLKSRPINKIMQLKSTSESSTLATEEEPNRGAPAEHHTPNAPEVSDSAAGSDNPSIALVPAASDPIRRFNTPLRSTADTQNEKPHKFRSAMRTAVDEDFEEDIQEIRAAAQEVRKHLGRSRPLQQEDSVDVPDPAADVLSEKQQLLVIEANLMDFKNLLGKVHTTMDTLGENINSQHESATLELDLVRNDLTWLMNAVEGMVASVRAMEASMARQTIPNAQENYVKCKEDRPFTSAEADKLPATPTQVNQ